MQRSRHVAFTTHRGGEHMRAEEQQATPVYDAIDHALRYADILNMVKYHDYPYETDVLWLLQHLPTASHGNDVEELLQERLAEQQSSNQFDPEHVLRMKALAEDIWHAWSQYLQRHEQSAFALTQSRARGLMGRHYYPRT